MCGSLRAGSYNKALLNAAAEVVPEGAEIEIVDIGGLPLFNQDFEKNLPSNVQEFKNKIKAVDAVLFVTPEYNYSIPGVLKNAIDWASRPYGDNSFDDKPAGIMGGSMGNTATARAQYHLRQTFVFLNMHAINRPEVLVPAIHEKIDATGRLTDLHTRDKVKELLEALVAFTKRLAAK
jgi:chromate reductase